MPLDMQSVLPIRPADDVPRARSVRVHGAPSAHSPPRTDSEGTHSTWGARDWDEHPPHPRGPRARVHAHERASAGA
jgi:hypothetical protein